MAEHNPYADPRRAGTYASLGFRGTYRLAYRDLPDLIARHVTGRRALDFGCGTGRSTRFLAGLGFGVVGVDPSPDMLAIARATDPAGDYRRIHGEDLARVAPGPFDLVLCAFPFDSIPTGGEKIAILRRIAGRLASGGRIVNLVSTPEIYTHEWVSFSTRDHPGNAHARDGDRVRIVITDTDDPRPVEDVVWSEDAYRDTYARAGLTVLESHRPLARDDEGERWVNETRIPPWALHVLAPAE